MTHQGDLADLMAAATAADPDGFIFLTFVKKGVFKVFIKLQPSKQHAKIIPEQAVFDSQGMVQFGQIRKNYLYVKKI